MPVTYCIDEALGIVTIQAMGDITDEELLSAFLVAYADAKFKPQFRCFSDFSHANTSKLSAACMAEIARINLFAASSRRAVLVKDLETFGLTRMVSHWNEVYNKAPPRIFTERASALAYLNEGLTPALHLK